jgi:aspartyl-tRNA(Asn)/glutamyl-tRNA(Gln) amidotransferase subunit A
MTDIASLDGVALIEAYGAGTLSPVEVIRNCLDRIGRFEPSINAFTRVEPQEALAAASASSERWRGGKPCGPLDGVPITIKDNILWEGRPARRGSRTTSDAAAVQSAPVVERLLAAGAIPLGKTTLPEFGWKGLGDSPLTGITRNPWDTRMTTGGSSAGAAAAAALNLGVLHLGTDGAGSIRIPCGFSGIFGLKPSYGRIPAHPPSPFAIVSHIGPMTRTVRDAALMMSVSAGPDPRDITALHEPSPDLRIGLEDGIAGLRVGWSPRLGYVRRLDPEVEALCAQAARDFEALGCVVEEADPDFVDPVDILNTLWHVGAWSVLRAIPESRWTEIDPGFVAAAQSGSRIPGADFVSAANARSALFSAMANYHARYDLLLTPTLAVPAFEGGHDTPPDGSWGSDWLSWTPYSYPFNLTLQPAASVPCGMTRSGLPVGLQIVGPMMGDALVMCAARAYEKLRPFPVISAPKSQH